MDLKEDQGVWDRKVRQENRETLGALELRESEVRQACREDQELRGRWVQRVRKEWRESQACLVQREREDLMGSQENQVLQA